MPNYKNFRQNGFASIWIILLIFLLGGLLALKQGYIKFPSKYSKNQPINSSKTLPTTQPTNKKLSLREVCLDKIKDLPAPPYSYKDKNTRGTLPPENNHLPFALA